MKKYDLIIIGAGAAGLSAARIALARGRSVLILDMGDKPARKVFVSGGGRCNFTNAAATSNRYFGKNPNFTKSILSRVKPNDILDWMSSHGLAWSEKTVGQYFCRSGAKDVVDALMRDASIADFETETKVTNIEKYEDEFTVYGKDNVYKSGAVIIATGGVSYPNLGVSDFGYRIAKKFGHQIVNPEPGLVGLKTNKFSPDLAGLSTHVKITIGKDSVTDSLLFTHVGIGGPAAYRASLFDLTNDMVINFVPDINVFDWLKGYKQTNGKRSIQTLLSVIMPAKLAAWFASDINKNIADFRDTELKELANMINNFVLKSGTVKRRGFDTAEVTRGGISTDEVSSKTCESKLIPGLYFAGEVLDITGDLGGFNLHFAFASGITAGNYA